MSNSTLGYSVTDNSGTALIYDNDTAPLTITTADTTVTENDGTTQATFRVQLNQSAPAGGVTLSYQTRNGTAIAGDDYT
ncbi:MAG TPA: hypothetical protein ENK95_04080, partial [Campylobacterales bacterium]|nr:hypothetical protein [Campylobacterales bacterium]